MKIAINNDNKIYNYCNYCYAALRFEMNNATIIQATVSVIIGAK